MGIFTTSPLGYDSAIEVLVEYLKICGKNFKCKRNIFAHRWTARNGTTRQFVCRFPSTEYPQIHAALGSLTPSDVESVYPALLRYATNNNAELSTTPTACMPFLYEMNALAQQWLCTGNRFIVLAHVVMASGARCPSVLMETFIAASWGDMMRFSNGCEYDYRENVQWQNKCKVPQKNLECFLIRQQRMRCLEQYDSQGGTRYHIKEGWPGMPYPDDFDKSSPGELPPMICSKIDRDENYNSIANGKGWATVKNIKMWIGDHDGVHVGVGGTFFLSAANYFLNPPQSPMPANITDCNTLSGAVMEAVNEDNPSDVVNQAQSQFSSEDNKYSRMKANVLMKLGLKTEDRTCDTCSKTSREVSITKLLTCTQCKTVFYCDSACQLKHWKIGGHKKECKQLQAMRKDLTQSGSMMMESRKKREKKERKRGMSFQ